MEKNIYDVGREVIKRLNNTEMRTGNGRRERTGSSRKESQHWKRMSTLIRQGTRGGRRGYKEQERGKAEWRVTDSDKVLRFLWHFLSFFLCLWWFTCYPVMLSFQGSEWKRDTKDDFPIGNIQQAVAQTASGEQQSNTKSQHVLLHPLNQHWWHIYCICHSILSICLELYW